MTNHKQDEGEFAVADRCYWGGLSTHHEALRFRTNQLRVCLEWSDFLLSIQPSILLRRRGKVRSYLLMGIHSSSKSHRYLA